jgi:tetratricopeptide (TPR) repeat protein
MSIAALTLALVAVVAIVLGNQTANEATRDRAEGAQGHSDHGSISARSGRSGQAGPATGSAAPASGISAGLGPAGTRTRISPADAEAFESQGHQLLVEGSYASAIDHLSAAIRASGQSLAGCIEPAGEDCLTFAYALYDLGRALRLEGRRAEAIAILSERLRIDNQRLTVQHELELARGASA